MRLYFYINKELIKRMAAKMQDVSFDIDFFEYSERRGYATNDSTRLRPEIENGSANKEERKDCFNKNKVEISAEKENLCNFEVTKRYINFEDISNIKNNNFYYNIIENVVYDERLKRKTGVISELEDRYFIIEDERFLMNRVECDDLEEIYNNTCEVTILGYKMNCITCNKGVYKVLSIYIE